MRDAKFYIINLLLQPHSKLAGKQKLVKEFPVHRDIIIRLCR